MSIDLASEGYFRLGGLVVRPASRELTAGDAAVLVEPRIMQVLVLLARRRGEVVGRQALIDACWDGRIVSEDVVNRAILKLRRALEALDPRVVIETIPRVGYRLVADAPDEPAAPERAPPPTPVQDRRRTLWIGAAGLAAIGTAGGAAWMLRPASVRSPEVEAFYQRGKAAFEEGSRDDNAQAVGFFERAAALAPTDAAVIGALALAYRFEQTFQPPKDLVQNTQRADAMVARCLSLNPRQADGIAARALYIPFRNHLFETEGRLREGLRKLPTSALLQTFLGKLLADAGRLHEALPLFLQASQGAQLVPLLREDLVNALFALGRVEEADRAADQAMGLWPRIASIWWLRFWLYIFTGRASEAAAQANLAVDYPSVITVDDVAVAQTVVAAADRRTEALTVRALDLLQSYCNTHPGHWPTAIGFAAHLGRRSEAFDLLTRYLSPYAEPLGQRLPGTNFLFRPPLRSLWPDPRFSQITALVGLDDYWRQSASRPDRL